ncbi:MAG: NrfD/PsrC family molybdoenzyme membrane anchor subunit [Nitrospirota bacterium]
MPEEEGLKQKNIQEMNEKMLSSIRPPTGKWVFLAVVLGAITGWAAYAWWVQLSTGLVVAGINRPVMWGFYIINFVFWVGLSHSGTMVSGILRLSKANWRRPILRAAEAMTVFAISVAAMFPLIHIGRTWKAYYLIPLPNSMGLWPNFRSPLLWDLTAINTYILGSSLFLFLGMLPDLAVVRDRSVGIKKKIYTVLAMGWRGTDREWSLYGKASTIMAALIVPVAVSVHSIVSWDFAMTLVPGWHSTIFAPYFVSGAMFSGVAAVITLMVILRKAFHLEHHLREEHFDNMGKLLLVISLVWSYLYFAEVLTIWYGHKPIEWEVFIFTADRYSFLLGLMVLGNAFITIPALCFRRVRRSVTVMLFISILVNVCMFTERFLIIVPPLSHRNVPFMWGNYSPSWVELSITAGALAGFALMYTMFAKFFPIVSLTDVREGLEMKKKLKIGRSTVNARIEGE